MKNTTTNKNGITAIYVRRSVSDKDKGNNSLSISAQREECIRFVGDCEYQVYCDDGKSGKDVQHRPAFMQMMQGARDGLISRIVVKKYDRFSRNMREYLNITDELDRYGVTVYSLSEPFNTETKEGRMMRNNLLNLQSLKEKQLPRVWQTHTAPERGRRVSIRAARFITVSHLSAERSTERQARCLFHRNRLNLSGSPMSFIKNRPLLCVM